jgi:hypothetical protein
VVKHLPKILETLGLIPSTEKNENHSGILHSQGRGVLQDTGCQESQHTTQTQHPLVTASPPKPWD